MKNAAKLVLDKLPKLKTSFANLAKKDVLVGVPRDDAARKDDTSDTGMNNATLAFIHNNGSPAQNIPARPFMEPGVEAAKPRVITFFAQAAKSALKDDAGAIDKALNKAGMVTSSAMKSKINEGIGPALKYSTLLARIRNRTAVKGAKMEIAARNAGKAPSLENAKPLVATAQMRNSINYVIRDK